MIVQLKSYRVKFLEAGLTSWAVASLTWKSNSKNVKESREENNMVWVTERETNISGQTRRMLCQLKELNIIKRMDERTTHNGNLFKKVVEQEAYCHLL